MGQRGPFMRGLQGGGFAHWCPACDGMHPLPKTWQFNGNVEAPTFTPSFNQLDVKGPGQNCHYIITDGQIYWAGGSWHDRTGSEPMVRLDVVDLSDEPLMWGEEK